jgi:hypothetical protein
MEALFFVCPKTRSKLPMEKEKEDLAPVFQNSRSMGRWLVCTETYISSWYGVSKIYSATTQGVCACGYRKPNTYCAWRMEKQLSVF